MVALRRIFISLDWMLLLSICVLVSFGLVTMKTFGVPGEIGNNYFFWRQLVWLALGVAAFFVAASTDWSFLKTNSIFLVVVYFLVTGLLFFIDTRCSGARSRKLD